MRTKFIENLENKIRLGVIDENIVASELKAVVKRYKAGAKVKNRIVYCKTSRVKND